MDSKTNCVPLHGTTLNWQGLVNMPDPVLLLNVAPQCRRTGTALACASNRLSWARLLWYFSVQPKRLLKIPIPFCVRGVSSVCPKGSRKNNFPCVGVDPSRLAALLVLSIRGVCAALAPCQTGASAPKHGKLFLREPYAPRHSLG